MRQNDLISRSALIAEYDRVHIGPPGGARKLMEDAPTIDPEELRPKGRWEMRGGKLYCTHCGERAAVARDSDDFWYTKGTPACPNCGCRMDGGNE